MHPDLNSKLPDCYVKLIQNCWSTDSGKRLEFTDIVKILRTPDFINNLNSKEQKKNISDIFIHLILKIFSIFLFIQNYSKLKMD